MTRTVSASKTLHVMDGTSPEWTRLFRSTERFAESVALARTALDGVRRFACAVIVRGGMDFWVVNGETGRKESTVAFLSQRFWPEEYP